MVSLDLAALLALATFALYYSKEYVDRAAGFWALLFTVIQTAVGIMLIACWKTRLSSKVGLVFLGLLIILEFTRYTPFVPNNMSPNKKAGLPGMAW